MPGGGATAAIDLGALFVNACLALLMLLTLRSCSPSPVAYRCGALVLFTVFMYVGVDTLRSPWNPNMAILAVLLFLLWASVFAAGSRSYLWPAIVLASYLIQLHVGFLVLAGFVMAAATLMHLALRRYPGTARGDVSWPRGRWRHAAWIPVVVLMWCPVVVGELLGSGNLGALWLSLRENSPQERPVDVLGTIWHGWAKVGLFVAGLAESEFPSRLHEVVERHGGWPWLAPLVVVATLFGVAARIAVRAGENLLGAMHAIVVASLVAAVVSVARIPGEIHVFLISWISIVGAWSWLPLLWSGAILRDSHVTTGRFASALPRLVVLILAVLLAGQVANQRHRTMAVNRDSAVVRELWCSLQDGADELLPSGPFVLRIDGNEAWHVAAGLMLRLLQHGYPARVEHSWTFMFGDQIAARGDEGHVVRVARSRPQASAASDEAWRTLAEAPPMVVSGRTIETHEAFYGAGWSHREDWGRFAAARRATLRLPVYSQGDTLRVDVATFLAMDRPQVMQIWYDQELQAEVRVDGAPWHWRTIELPVEQVATPAAWRTLEITFRFAHRWKADATDPRVLALPFRRVTTTKRLAHGYE